MKMRTKIITAFVLVICALTASLYLYNTGICSPFFNKDYYKWFPYKTGDTLVFKSGISKKKYLVSYYITNHNNTYFKFAKCGCCEDGINISLISKTDTIDVDMMNFENANNCLGEHLSVGKYMVQNYTNHYELLIKTKIVNKIRTEYISIKKDTFIISKNIGISSFIFENKTYIFDRIIKSGSENTQQSSYCD